MSKEVHIKTVIHLNNCTSIKRFWLTEMFLSKMLGNSDEFPASLDSRLAISKMNSIELRQNNFFSSKGLINESHSKDSHSSLYNLAELTK